MKPAPMFPLPVPRCDARISCANCTLGRRCFFAEMVGDAPSIPLNPPRAEHVDSFSLETMCGYSEGEGHGAPRFIPSDDPEE